jgi:HSP20 family protein
MKQEATAIQPAKETPALKLVTFDDVFDRMRKISDAISRRAFELFEGNGRTLGRELDDWFKAESELLHPLHLDVTETDNALAVKAEVPGFNARELEVSVEPRRLTITGKRESKEEQKDKNKKIVYTERCADNILRVVNLPAEVDAEKVTATLKDGVLELTMPKAAPAKKVRVEPKVA